MNKKLKVMRIVTVPEAVSFHLRNTLQFISQDFETIVVGTNVETFRSQYPEIRWVNLEISRGINIQQDLVSLTKLGLLLLKEKPDILHSIMPKAGFVAALAGFLFRVPIRIHTFTGQIWIVKTGFSKRLFIFLDKVIVLLNTYCFTDSDSQSLLLFQHGIKKNGQPLPVLGKGSLSGVDLRRFNFELFEGKKKNLRVDNGIPTSSIVFIFLGRKCRDKGIFELLEAFKKVHDDDVNTFLLLVGPDESDGEFERLVGQFGLNPNSYKNIGMTDRAQDYLAMSDIFCLPSYREGFGSVVIEAGALGLPSIGSDIPGLRDSIQEGKTGLVVPVKNVIELSKAMSRMANDGELRRAMSKNSLEFVRSYFDSKKVYQLLLDLYQKEQISVEKRFLQIAIHSYVYYPEQFLITELAEELVRCGHRIQVYTGLPNYPEGKFFKGYSLLKGPYREFYRGVEVIRYPIAPRGKGFLLLAINYLSHVFSAILFSYRLKRADIHFVYAPSPITTAIPAIVRARWTGAKVCLWLQDIWPESVSAVGAASESSIIYRLIERIVRWIYGRLDLILIQSPAFQSNLDQFGYLGPSEYIPNWAPDLFAQEEKSIPEWLNNFPRDFTVTFAGNVGIAQGIDTVLQAAYELRNDDQVKFIIVGDGSSLEESQQFVLKNKLKNIIFYGRRPLKDMPALFSLSSCVLVSLKKARVFEKTIPSKIQAYMAAGKPILASLDGIGAEIVSSTGSGLASAAEDVNGLVKNIREIKKASKEELKRYGDCARRQFYQNFQKDKIIRQIESSLENLK